jgi:hypothetical protein
MDLKFCLEKSITNKYKNKEQKKEKQKLFLNDDRLQITLRRIPEGD